MAEILTLNYFYIMFVNVYMTILNKNVRAFFGSSPKCIIYKHIVDSFCLQSYLTKPICIKYKKAITRLRLSSHRLLIETGRHKNIPRDRRFCPLCKEDIEDEFHFILKCHILSTLRCKYIKSYYRHNPSVYKLTMLLSTDNVKDLNNLGKYLHHADITRSDIISRK